MELVPDLRVVVVEDHPEFREALGHTLRHWGRMAHVELCKDLPAGREAIEAACPHLLLVDLGLPSGSGLNLIRLARVLWGDECCSAVLTVTGNEEYLLKAVNAGVSGYLFKSEQPPQWMDTLANLAAGRSPLNAHVAQLFQRTVADLPERERMAVSRQAQEVLKWVAAGYTLGETSEKLGIESEEVGRLVRGVYASLRTPLPRLSPRELQLMRHLGRGLAFKECAEAMGVSESTTKTQANRAYQKLGATNLQSALYEARKAGLLS